MGGRLGWRRESRRKEVGRCCNNGAKKEQSILWGSVNRVKTRQFDSTENLIFILFHFDLLRPQHILALWYPLEEKYNKTYILYWKFYNSVRDMRQYKATINLVVVIPEFHFTYTMGTPKGNQLFRQGTEEVRIRKGVFQKEISGISELLDTQNLILTHHWYILKFNMYDIL